MATPDPQLVPAAWDMAVLDNRIMPGLAEVLDGGGRVLGWDEAKGYGTSGAAKKFTGAKLTVFTLRLSFWEGVRGLSGYEQRFEYLEEFVPLLQKCETGKVALPFYHPAVSEPPQNVTVIVPEEIGRLQQTDAGLWFVDLKLSDFRAPKPAVGTPKKSGGAAKATAKDEADKQIDDLSSKLKKLGTGEDLSWSEVFG